MKFEGKREITLAIAPLRGLLRRLLSPFGNKLGWADRSRPRLALVERIALAPRQSLALVEAEGRLLLVATSAEGGPAFYPLEPSARRAAQRIPQTASRVSW
jgi:hypothetical protein